MAENNYNSQYSGTQLDKAIKFMNEHEEAVAQGIEDVQNAAPGLTSKLDGVETIKTTTSTISDEELSSCNRESSSVFFAELTNTKSIHISSVKANVYNSTSNAKLYIAHKSGTKYILDNIISVGNLTAGVNTISVGKYALPYACIAISGASYGNGSTTSQTCIFNAANISTAAVGDELSVSQKLTQYILGLQIASYSETIDAVSHSELNECVKVNDIGKITSNIASISDTELSECNRESSGIFLAELGNNGDAAISQIKVNTYSAVSGAYLFIAHKEGNKYFFDEKSNIGNLSEGVNIITVSKTVKAHACIGVSGTSYGSGSTTAQACIFNTNNIETAAVGDELSVKQNLTQYKLGIQVVGTCSSLDVVKHSELESVVSGSVLTGKKIIAIGDSMVQGHSLSDANGQTWLAKIAVRNGMTRINKGTNGSFMINRTLEGVKNSVYHKICDSTSPLYISDAVIAEQNYIIVYAGTNDCANNITIGTADSSDTTEFCGALNAICNTLQTRAPKAHIAFITPQKRQNLETRCQTYIDAIKTVCKKYSIPVYDQGDNCGINWSNSAIKSALTLNDTYHLNEDGMEFISYKYEHFIKGV